MLLRSGRLPNFLVLTLVVVATASFAGSQDAKEIKNGTSEDSKTGTEAETATQPVLTGNPQIDYIHDPNLPRELNGYDLSDYPFYNRVPDEKFNFTCDDRHDGFYASVPHKCQVYHNCLFGVRYDFLCANYTAFDQKNFICHFVSEVDCINSEKYFHRNNDLYETTTTTTASPPPRQIVYVERRRPSKPIFRQQRPNKHRLQTAQPLVQQKPVYDDYYQYNDYYSDYSDYYDYYDDGTSGAASSTTTTTTRRPIPRRPQRTRLRGGQSSLNQRFPGVAGGLFPKRKRPRPPVNPPAPTGGQSRNNGAGGQVFNHLNSPSQQQPSGSEAVQEGLQRKRIQGRRPGRPAIRGGRPTTTTTTQVPLEYDYNYDYYDYTDETAPLPPERPQISERITAREEQSRPITGSSAASETAPPENIPPPIRSSSGRQPHLSIKSRIQNRRVPEAVTHEAEGRNSEPPSQTTSTNRERVRQQQIIPPQAQRRISSGNPFSRVRSRPSAFTTSTELSIIVEEAPIAPGIVLSPSNPDITTEADDTQEPIPVPPRQERLRLQGRRRTSIGRITNRAQGPRPLHSESQSSNDY